MGLGLKPFKVNHCKVKTCYATNNRSLFDYDELDAVLWHLGAIDKSLPPQRWETAMCRMSNCSDLGE